MEAIFDSDNEKTQRVESLQFRATQVLSKLGSDEPLELKSFQKETLFYLLNGIDVCLLSATAS